MNVPAKPTVLFVVGPTASGKTESAFAIIDALNRCGRSAEIVSADSRQVYRDMSIGTAKPTPKEMAMAPHHLIDVANPSDGFSLARFLDIGRKALKEIAAREATAIVVGGTGQYVWGLAEGWQAPTVAPNPMIRARLEDEATEFGEEALHERLRIADPESAKLIDPRNIRRLVRALEVIEVTGKPFSAQRAKVAPWFEARMLALTLSRADLYDRIDARVDAMISTGWVCEVASLLAAGNKPDIPAFSSAGYRQIALFLAGEISLDEATRRAKIATHRLARSQSNWFRSSDTRIAWHQSIEGLVQGAIDSCCP